MEDKANGFEGIWIPKKIWMDKELTASEKIIYAVIACLDNDAGCTATNNYLAEYCQCTVKTVSQAISHLIRSKYIKQDGFDGRRRKLLVCVEENDKADMKKTTKLHRKNFYAEWNETTRQTGNKVQSHYIDKKDYKKDDKKEYITYQQQTDNFMESENEKIEKRTKEYGDNENIHKALQEYVKVRERIKKPLTDEDCERLLNKLTSISETDSERLAIIDNSIINQWSNFYPLKKEELERIRNEEEKDPSYEDWKAFIERTRVIV